MRSTWKHFKEPDPGMEASINDLIRKMTLEEKIDMLGGVPDQRKTEVDGNTVPCARVGIPSFRMADASTGVHWWTDESCTFPASIGLAATFDVELGAAYGKAIGRECRARGVHILLGPGVNIYRSPLCGRNFEYLGEDPLLASRMVTAYIQALQGEGVAATVKHYAVNYQEYERHKVSSDLDERTLREIYLPAFEAAVTIGGSAAVMTAYNLVNSVHCAEHTHLLTDILKGEWRFDGVVMSDWVSTYDAVNSATAGLDLEMPTAVWMNRKHLVPAVNNGLVAERVIDDKLRRLLRMAFAFGWMEHPQKDASIPEKDETSAALALTIARDSLVLLKNDGLLPLSFPEHKRIAVIGTSSHPAVISGGGAAYNKPWRAVSILDGIKAAAGSSEVVHVKGVNPWPDDQFRTSEFRTPTGEPGLMVEYYPSNDLSGAPALVRTENNVDNLWRDKPIGDGAVEKSCFSIRWRAVLPAARAGQYWFWAHCWDGAFRVLIDGRAVFDSWQNQVMGDREFRAELTQGNHELVLEFRNVREWNQFRFGYRNGADMLSEHDNAVAAAKAADLVIFCGGHTERSEMEGADRSFGMFPEIDQLLCDVLAANSNTVVVLTGGGNIDMNAWHDQARAILMAWYPGQEGGTAVADVVSGKVNPSGRLPATFEKRLEDRSSFGCYHDHDHDRRVALSDGVFVGYRHHDRTRVKPRYPFGYGLGYTTFEYAGFALSRASISRAELEAGESIEVSFEVANCGKRAGKEAPQVYVGDVESSVPRPPKELKGFAKLSLDPGSKERVRISLDRRAFAFWSLEQARWVIEPGTFTIFVAANAEDVRAELALEVS